MAMTEEEIFERKRSGDVSAHYMGCLSNSFGCLGKLDTVHTALPKTTARLKLGGRSENPNPGLKFGDLCAVQSLWSGIALAIRNFEK
jgi:hypothetical protein